MKRTTMVSIFATCLSIGVIAYTIPKLVASIQDVKDNLTMLRALQFEDY